MAKTHQHSEATERQSHHWRTKKAPDEIQSPLYRLCQPGRHSPTDIYTPCAARCI